MKKILMVALAAFSLLSISCAASFADDKKEPAKPKAGKTVDVTIEGFAYKPATVKIKAGDSVTFTNKDSAPHTVTPEKGASFAGSGRMLKNESKTITFDKSGKQNYFCEIHPSMKGVVDVKQ